jgi:hypothetical protein
MAAFGVSNRRIEATFASVKREDFLGRGLSWQIVRWGPGYDPLPVFREVGTETGIVRSILCELQSKAATSLLQSARSAATR